MISKRNYFTITMMMLVMFFLFQFTGAAKLMLSHYEINEYDTGKRPETPKNLFEPESLTEGSFVWYYGTNLHFWNMLQEYCRYRRFHLVRAKSVKQMATYEAKMAQLYCIEGSQMTENDVSPTQYLLRKRVKVCFLDLPSTDFLGNHLGFTKNLGIIHIENDRTLLDGIRLSDGFLLGGSYYYQTQKPEDKLKLQDFSLVRPWYVVGSGCTIYLSGILPEKEEYEKIQAGYFPSLLWSYRGNTGSIVFCSNGEYLQDIGGMGLLLAMESTVSEYTIYPVVNASCLVFENFPTFAEENTDTLHEKYERTAEGVIRDLIWPATASLPERTSFKPTYLISDCLRNDRAKRFDKDVVEEFFELIRELHGEVGLSISVNGNTDGVRDYFGQMMPKYRFLSGGIGMETPSDAEMIYQTAGFDGISTFLEKPALTERLLYMYNQTLVLSVINDDGREHTFSKDLHARSIATGMGLVCSYVDLSRLIYPSDVNDELQIALKDIASRVETYYRPLRRIEATSLTELGERARTYLSCQYSSKKNGNQISLVSNAAKETPQYYFLRIPGMEIKTVSMGRYRKLQDSFYLLEVPSGKIEIETQPNQVRFSFIEDEFEWKNGEREEQE